MPSDNFTLRLPPDVEHALREQASKNGQSRAAITIRALRVHLGLDFAEPHEKTETGPHGAVGAVLDMLRDLERQISELQQRVVELEAGKPARQQRNTKSNAAPSPMTRTPRKASIPTDGDGWLSVREAFVALGGDPANAESTIQSREGRSTKFVSFKTNARTPGYFERFGLLEDRDRKDGNKPWLRLSDS